MCKLHGMQDEEHAALPAGLLRHSVPLAWVVLLLDCMGAMGASLAVGEERKTG